MLIRLFRDGPLRSYSIFKLPVFTLVWAWRIVGSGGSEMEERHVVDILGAGSNTTSYPYFLTFSVKETQEILFVFKEYISVLQPEAFCCCCV